MDKNVIEYIKEHLLQLITLIPVIFIAFGSFVLNIYLNQFGVIDITLFDSRTGFVGFVALFQIVCFFFFWAMDILKYTSSNRFIFLIINCFFKSVVFSIIIAAFGNNSADSVLKKTVGFVISEGHSVLTVFFAVGIAFTYGMLKSNSEENLWKTGKIIDKIYYILGLIFSISFLTVSVFFIGKDEILSKIFKAYNGVSIFLSGFLFYIWYRKKRFTEKNEDVFKFNKISKLDYVFTFLYLIILVMLFLITYSKHVFPNISSNLGGGSFKYNNIILEDKSSITGKIIHSNSNFIYIIEEENKLSQYTIDRIRAYTIVNNSESKNKPEALAVAEIVEPKLGYKVMEYNHYRLKDDIDKKKQILLMFADELEPKRDKLKEINSIVENDLFFMFNNLNIRHNNITESSKNYKKYVAEMDNKTLEEWYDETYQLCLFAFLELDNVERKKRISQLKKDIN